MGSEYAEGYEISSFHEQSPRPIPSSPPPLQTLHKSPPPHLLQSPTVRVNMCLLLILRIIMVNHNGVNHTLKMYLFWDIYIFFITTEFTTEVTYSSAYLCLFRDAKPLFDK
eukprot:GHVR01178400.1.p1 GENE.GHVR01178400.1~~GHVR01178400.1.p1  ORF type:complete len:111 (-),score=17.22 GHVR01178400.1:580-912(-)